LTALRDFFTEVPTDCFLSSSGVLTRAVPIG
jgi:hypothetical protein